MFRENHSEEIICSDPIESATALSDISQEMTVFSGCQKLTSSMKPGPEKL